MQSEQIDAIATALAKAQGEMKPAVKDANNPHFGKKYADLASVWEACRDPLAKNGLAVAQTPVRDESGIVLVTTLLHTSGQWIRSEIPLPATSTQGRGLQEFGSALTYARRYGLAAMVGVAPDDDDDGEGAAGGAPPARTEYPQPQGRKASKPEPASDAPIDPALVALAAELTKQIADAADIDAIATLAETARRQLKGATASIVGVEAAIVDACARVFSALPTEEALDQSVGKLTAVRIPQGPGQIKIRSVIGACRRGLKKEGTAA